MREAQLLDSDKTGDVTTRVHAQDTPQLHRLGCLAWRRLPASMGTNAGRKKTIMTRRLIGDSEGRHWLDSLRERHDMGTMYHIRSLQFKPPVLRSERTQHLPRPCPPGKSDNDAVLLTKRSPHDWRTAKLPQIPVPSPAPSRPIEKMRRRKVGPRRPAEQQQPPLPTFSRAKKGSKGAI